MSLTLLTAPSAGGKTAHLVARAAERYRADPFAPTLVLVPTARHADQFRRRLVSEVGAAFGLEVTTVGGWAREVATAAGTPLASYPVVNALLGRAVAAATMGPAAEWAPIAEAPGLVSRVATAVQELVAEGVDGTTLAHATSSADAAAIRPLAAVVRGFEREMAAAGRVHPAAAAACAADAIAGGAAVLPPLVLADGFDYLHAGEIALLAALAARTEVVVALDPGATARGAHAQGRLLQAVPGARVERLPGSIERSTPVRRSFSAADRDAELRAIARDIKERLTGDPSLRPSDFAVGFRQVTPVLPLARQVFAEYDLPLDPAAAFALGSLPFGTWVRRFLSLGVDGWRLHNVVAVLRGGFIDRSRWGLDRGHVATIGSHGRRTHLWGGDGDLRRLAEGLRRPAVPGTDDAVGVPSEREVAAGAGLLSVLDDLVPLLDPARRERPGVFAAELDARLFGTRPIVRPGAPARGEIDAFRSLLRARADVDEVVGSDPVAFADFVAGLTSDMGRPAVAVREAGGVVLAPLHTLHGLRFRYLAVGGLVEGEFPAPRRLPGLLDGPGREALLAAGLPLPPTTRASEDELFAVAITRADSTLVLARPRIDADGRRRAGSHFFPLEGDEQRVPWLIEPERTASRSELAVALVGEWPTGARRPRAFEPWTTVRLAAEVEAIRRSFAPAGAFEGQLGPGSGAGLVASDVRWSASRLESYAYCAFQFFATYGLGLRELDQELLQADAATFGTVIHDILEAALQPLAVAGEALRPANLESVMNWLDTNGGRLWNEAPARHGFGRAGLWRLRWPRVHERLARLLREEAAAGEANGMERLLDVELELNTELPTRDGPLRFTGKIDRAEQGGDTGTVVDYKSGGAIPARDIEEAQRLQLQLYAAALMAQRPGVERVIARYAYLRPVADRDRFVVDTATTAGSSAVAAALERAAEIRTRVHGGHFEVMPGPFRDDPARRICPSFCPFRHVCRVGPTSRWKPWR